MLDIKYQSLIFTKLYQLFSLLTHTFKLAATFNLSLLGEWHIAGGTSIIEKNQESEFRQFRIC